MLRTAAAFLVLGLTACSTTPDKPQPYSFGNVTVERGQESPERVLLDLDGLLELYAQTRLNQGSPRSEQQLMQVEDAITKLVDKNFDLLHKASIDDRWPAQRSTALASLGFANDRDRPQAREALVNGLYSDDPSIINNAVLGLEILSDPQTSAPRLQRVVANEDLPPNTRGTAATCLYKLQSLKVEADRKPIIEFWLEILAQAIDAAPAQVTLQAIRGVAETRDPAHFGIIVRYAAHPVPVIRQVTALALGYLGDEEAIETLLTLVSPAEPNENVRLYARKALQAFAGNDIDRRYDVEAWRKVFERK